jgi:RimJ/RimL family protein N-acetyltransferase
MNDTSVEPDVTWVPSDWDHPLHVVVDADHHLRPIRASDVDLDLPAVQGSRDRLWSIYGRAWGWPPVALTREDDLADLARHEAETEAHESFNYALFDAGETRLLGCLYVDPPQKVGADAEISWWVVDELVGTTVAAALDALVPAWITAEWPLERPRYIGHDVSWDAWLDLPDLPTPSTETA